MKKFKKFILLEPNTFDKIKSLSIDTSNLTNTERQLISILQNALLSPSQRLSYYKMLLNRNIPNQGVEHPLTSSSKENEKIAKSTQTVQRAKNFSTQTESFLPKLPRLQNESIYDSSLNQNVDSSQRIEISDSDSDREIDIMQEKANLVETIIQASGDPSTRINNLSFKNINDPNSDFISIVNKETGTSFSVDKPEAIKKLQKRQSISQLPQPKKVRIISPRRTRERKKKTDSPGFTWDDYDMMKKRNI